ncbi:MAG: alpha/beta fold hydrolase [Planctomycetota bacterium]|nr:alpha/beta fold hydrolase [Planctomycetota bacterium]
MIDALLPPGADHPGRIENFEGADGLTLRYRAVEADAPRHHLLYCHGIESHGTWFLPAAERLAQRGITTWLLDRRGSGLNRSHAPGDARTEGVLLRDIGAFRRHVGDPSLHLVGLSWGGKLATASAIASPGGVKSLILITPGLKAIVDLTIGQKLRLLASLPFGGRAKIPIPISSDMFTETNRYLEFIENDTWRLRHATARFFLASLKLDKILKRGMRDLDVPVLLFLAGGERIIDNAGVLNMLSPLSEERLVTRMYDDATHSIQFDQVDRMVGDIVQFLDDRERP